MNVEISTESLTNLCITADEHLYLYLLHQKAYVIISSLSLPVDKDALQTKGYLKLGQETSDHVVREPFYAHLESPFSQMWAELLAHFPLRVQSRVLRARDVNAKANEKPRNRYEKYLDGNAGKHREVIKALKTELDIRKKDDSLKYMQQLTTWVNNHSWEKYIGLEDEPNTSAPSRTTRQL